LGLPETTALEIRFDTPSIQNTVLAAFIDSALTNREEIKEGQLRSKIAETNVKSLHADYAPVLGAGTNLYYINPNGTLLPATKTFLAPLTIGASLSWNIDKLWTNKSKIAEAKIQQNEAQLNTEIASDNIKTEVNAGFQNYLKSLDRIKLLQQSIEQARENDRILESKYRNNIASATDRIDAETQLYQALINLELAKADASLAYYSLLNTTGTLTHQIL
jgi:outer membrane protein